MKSSGQCQPGGCSYCESMNIEPLAYNEHGAYINPVFDSVKVFRLGAEPFGVVVGPGDSADISLVAQAEENHYGDLLINELLASTLPSTGRFSVTIKSQQNDRIFMNTPIIDRLVFGNSQFGGCLPCCFPIQATNFVQLTVTNLDVVDLTINVVARAMRLLPYQFPQLRDHFLQHWNSLRVTPYWLGIDRVFQAAGIDPIAGGGVTIPSTGTATVLMTVPGGGDFLAKELLTVVDGVGGAVDSSDIIADIKEGVGRSIMDRPLPLGSFLAQPLSAVAGLQGGELKPASGNWCRQYNQFFKRNTRVRITLENTAAFPARVYLAFKGCVYYYDECAPGRGLNRSLSLEPTIGPMFQQQPRGCVQPQQFAPGPYGTGMQPVFGGPPQQVPPTGYAALPGTEQTGVSGIEYPDNGRGGWGRR